MQTGRQTRRRIIRQFLRYYKDTWQRRVASGASNMQARFICFYINGTRRAFFALLCITLVLSTQHTAFTKLPPDSLLYYAVIYILLSSGLCFYDFHIYLAERFFFTSDVVNCFICYTCLKKITRLWIKFPISYNFFRNISIVHSSLKLTMKISLSLWRKKIAYKLSSLAKLTLMMKIQGAKYDQISNLLRPTAQ